MTATDMDVVDVLTADHRDVTGLIGEIRAAGDATVRRDVTDMMISELVRHAVAEEMYVYPAMRKHLPDGEKAVQHDVEEHKEIEQTLKRLESADVSTAEFTRDLDKLEELLADHVQDEENDQFPRLRAHVSREKLVQMREQVDRAKKLAPTRPHPAAPNSEVFHKLVGPGVGLMDRVRDRLTGRTTA